MSLIGEEFNVTFPHTRVERVRVVSNVTSSFGRRFTKSYLVRVVPRARNQYTPRYNLLYEVAADDTTGISLDTADWRLLDASGESAAEWRVGDFVWAQFYDNVSCVPEARLSLTEVLEHTTTGFGSYLVYVHTGSNAGLYMRAIQQRDLSTSTRMWTQERPPKLSLRPRFDRELPSYDDTLYSLLDEQQQ
jgi:hypothetical protein